MIQNIWIVEKDRGRRLFHKRYGSIDIDPDLFSAFLTGLYAFAEAELGETGIDSIEMGDLKWIYIYSNNLLFVIAGDKDDNVPHLKAQLNVIKNSFFFEFPEFTKHWQEKYKHTGFKDILEEFHPIVDDLVKDWVQLAEITAAANFMDICEVCQHVISLLGKIVESYDEQRKKSLLDTLKLQIFDLIKDDPELSKVISEDGSIDILRVNVFELTQNAVIILQNILITSFYTLRNELGHSNFQAMVRKKFIPYLKLDWRRIRFLGFDNLLIHLL
jgi:hypothetical protein